MFRKEITCEHYWEIKDACFTPPIRREIQGTFNEYIFKVVVYGVTHIYSICKKCGEVKRDEHFGRFTPPGFTWSK